MIKLSIKKSTKKQCKLMATFIDTCGNNKVVHFGRSGYSDYTIHKDPERMKRYLKRHKSREKWTGRGLFTAGALSRWILWSKPDLKTAITDYKKKVSKIKCIK